MANRPTMNGLRRQVQNLENKVSGQQEEIRKLEKEVKSNTARIGNVERNEIIEKLQEKNTPNSNRYRYTYQEIADDVGCTKSTVTTIAKETGLSRRLRAVD